MGLTYRDAGVDIEAGNESVKRIKKHIKTTLRPEVLTEIGGFGGLFAVPQGYHEPVLVASMDGVGTKLKIAIALDKHDTVGEDLVCHCINDILVQGAKPLFFLDYIATGHLDPEIIEAIVSGLARGCREGGCALLGGETAEMPGFYQANEYDLAGTIIGVVEKKQIILGHGIRPGDAVIGLASNGLHTNGYSLARKICFEILNLKPDSFVPEINNHIGLELLKTHRCYEKPLRPLLNKNKILGMAHITGGGFLDNIPRILPDNCQVVIKEGTWEIPAIFLFLKEKGEVPEMDMYRTFNMGIGMVVIVRPESVKETVKLLNDMGEKAYVIGEVIQGEKKVVITK